MAVDTIARGMVLNFRMKASLLAQTDNVYDIGASAASRPRNIYVGSNVIAGTTGQISFHNRGAILSPADGVLVLANNALTDFNRLQFGGTSASFPSLKRSATVLQARLADDSDFGPLQGKLRAHADAAAETPVATHTLRLFDAAGTEYKVLAVPV